MITVEKALVSSGHLSENQVNEIREMFMIVDADRSGEVSYDEVAKLMSKLSKTQITREEALKIIEKIDLNKDGVITWDEFLQAMYNWLLESKSLDVNKKDESNPTERKIMHLNLANFFMQFNQDKNAYLIQALYAEQNVNLEDRPESWDFFWTKTTYTNDEKWAYYQENQKLLESFSLIVQQVNSDDVSTVTLGLQNTLKLLTIVQVFKSPAERFEISNHIIRIFDLMVNSSLINKVCYILNNAQDPILQWDCLKIVSIFAPGPRIANTPETSILHPGQIYHKILMVNNGILQTCLKLTHSNCIEVKEQAILAVGFFVRNSTEIRDLIVSLNGVQILCDAINQESPITSVQRMSLTLSFFAGVSQNKEGTGGPSSDANTTMTLLQTFTWLLFWKDDVDILSNSLMGLTYILPVVELTYENQSWWERVVKMLTHTNVLVKRAALNCLKNIISSNELQCQFCVEQKMLGFLSELLHIPNLNIKIEACHLITLLTKRGYSWYILDSSVIANVVRILYEDSNVRWDCVKILEKISSQSGEFNKILLQAGVIKSLFANLHGFKDYDKILSEIYGYLDPSYNFKFLTDSIQVLNNLVTVTVGVSNVQEYITVLTQLLEQGNFDKLQNVLDIFFGDIYSRKIDFLQLSGDISAFSALTVTFVANCISVFKLTQATEYSSRMIQFLTTLGSNFEKKLTELDAFIKSNPWKHDSIVLKTLEVRCFSKENFPNGDNRVLEVHSNISLLELILQIEHRYQRSPVTLHYIDEFQEQITIDTDSILKRAIERGYHESVKNNSDRITLKLIVNSPHSMLKYNDGMNGSYRSNNLFADKIFDIYSGGHTNLLNKDNLLQDLSSRTNLNKWELEKIYNSFVQTALKRPNNQADGAVTLQEFTNIMKDYVNDISVIEEFFHALDINKTQTIDFRHFVCAMSLMKTGTLEDKLKFAFMAYDTNHNGSIDKQEMLKLIIASARARGMLLTDNELINAVEKVFQSADKNNDGVLNYEEFKSAIVNNQLLINPFWTSSKILPVFQNQNYSMF